MYTLMTSWFLLNFMYSLRMLSIANRPLSSTCSAQQEYPKQTVNLEQDINFQCFTLLSFTVLFATIALITVLIDSAELHSFGEQRYD